MIYIYFAMILFFPLAISGPFYGRNIKPALLSDPMVGRQGYGTEKYCPEGYGSEGYGSPRGTEGYGCRCGERKIKRKKQNKEEERIIGGDAIENDGWIALLNFEEATRQYQCAGTIINNKYILTALHCVVKNASLEISNLEIVSTTMVSVHIGGKRYNNQKRKKNKRNKNKKIKDKYIKDQKKGKKKTQKKFRNFKTFEVEEIVLNDAGADLALIKVAGTINTQVYPPICLPKTQSPYAVQSSCGVAAGWGGKQTNTGRGALKGLVVPITNDVAQCPALKNQADQKNWFCFGGEEGKSACLGDSGGPVMVQENVGENRWTLAGIISGGTVEPCGAFGGFGLAVDVYRWIDWVTFTAFDGEYC